MNPQQTRILIIEDDPAVATSLQEGLERESYVVAWKDSGQDGVAYARDHNPHLVILDVRLPDGSGFDFCRQMRQQGLTQPIIMLTVRRDDIDKILGLEMGADDYVTKPFRIREFIARLKAILRRGSPSPENGIDIGECRINFKARTATKGSVSLNLTATEWSLLELFHRNRNCVISREQIIDFIWKVKDLEDSRAVDVHIGRLRKKLGDADPPKLLQTVRGLGYKLV